MFIMLAKIHKMERRNFGKKNKDEVICEVYNNFYSINHQICLEKDTTSTYLKA